MRSFSGTDVAEGDGRFFQSKCKQAASHGPPFVVRCIKSSSLGSQTVFMKKQDTNQPRRNDEKVEEVLTGGQHKGTVTLEVMRTWWLQSFDYSLQK
jgi:hypothetical protein